MLNFIAKGDKITVVATASGVKGDPVVLDDMAAVPENSFAVGEDMVLLLEGIVSLAKSAEAFAAGEKLYWDDGNGYVTKTASTHKPIGWSANVYATGVSTANVKLGAW